MLENVTQKLEVAEGLNLDLWKENLNRADDAIKCGDYSLGRGLGESILRQLENERESMEKIRIVLRQRNKLKSKWANLGTSNEWDKRLEEIESSAEKLEWSHAAILFQRLNEDLELELESFNEANELLDFAKKEWFSLRENSEKVGIDILDKQRIKGDQLISEAFQNIEDGNIQKCLELLGDLDLIMEKLRRRI